jgi:NAD-dependent dihydropyrimidine dehydrogenase PreA subunit
MAISKFTLAVDEKRCTACGSCVMVCPQGNFEIVEKNGRIFSRWQDKGCERCGLCLRHCDCLALLVLSRKAKAKTKRVDHGLCVACEQCVRVCPEHNFEIGLRKAKYVAVQRNKAKCLGDNRCVFVCNQNAIKW